MTLENIFKDLKSVELSWLKASLESAITCEKMRSMLHQFIFSEERTDEFIKDMLGIIPMVCSELSKSLDEMNFDDLKEVALRLQYKYHMKIDALIINLLDWGRVNVPVDWRRITMPRDIVKVWTSRGFDADSCPGTGSIVSIIRAEKRSYLCQGYRIYDVWESQGSSQVEFRKTMKRNLEVFQGLVNYKLYHPGLYIID